MKRKLKIFTYGFYIGMILWMCGLVASMTVDNVTIKMLLIFIPLAIYQFFTIGKGIIEDLNLHTEIDTDTLHDYKRTKKYFFNELGCIVLSRIGQLQKAAGVKSVFA